MSPKWSIAGHALSALVGAVVGSVLSIHFLAPARAQKSLASNSLAPETAEAPSGQGDVEQRLSSIEERLNRFNHQARLAAGVARATAAASGDPTAQPAGALDNAQVVDNPVFEAAVRDVVGRIEEERNTQREADMSEWRETRATDWSNQLASKLTLTDSQKNAVKQVALDYWQHARDVWNADAGTAGSWEERRNKFRELGTQSETKLAEVLSPQQMTSYRELGDDEKLGTRGRGRFRDNN